MLVITTQAPPFDETTKMLKLDVDNCKGVDLKVLKALDDFNKPASYKYPLKALSYVHYFTTEPNYRYGQPFDCHIIYPDILLVVTPEEFEVADYCYITYLLSNSKNITP